MKNLYLLFLCLTINLWLFFPQAQPVEAFGEGCAIYRTSVQSIPSGIWTAISFNAERRDDSLQCHVADSTIMSVAEGYAGWYSISGNISWATVPGTGCMAILRNDSTIAINAGPAVYQAVTTLFYLDEGDSVQLFVLQTSGNPINIAAIAYFSPEFRMVRIGPGSHSAFNSIQSLPGVASTPQVPQIHASNHQDGGPDEINVAGLSGILTDTQDAAWFQGLAITTTGVTDGQVLAWNTGAEEWQPATVSGTGGLMDIITATISGTVPVIITNTYQFTELLSSGHDVAIIRSFTYGEASIAIGLFVVAAVLGIQLLFALQRR